MAVGDPCMPSLCSIETQQRSLRAPRLPSGATRNFGATKREIPRVPAGASGNRASTRWMMFSATSCSPQVMKIFDPNMSSCSIEGRGGAPAGQTAKPGVQAIMGSACSRVGMVRTGAGSSTNASPEMTTTPLTVHSVLSSTRDRSERSFVTTTMA